MTGRLVQCHRRRMPPQEELACRRGRQEASRCLRGVPVPYREGGWLRPWAGCQRACETCPASTAARPGVLVHWLAGGLVRGPAWALSSGKRQTHPKGLRSHSCESLSPLCCSAGGWPTAWAPGGVLLFPQAGIVSRRPPSDRAAAGVGDGCGLGDSDWPPGEARRLGRRGRRLHNLTPESGLQR